MLTLKNGTKKTSQIGYLAKVSVKGDGYFEVAGIGEASCGVITEATPPNGICKIATDGEEALLFIKDRVRSGDRVRQQLTDDGAGKGQMMKYKREEGCSIIGTALESGKNKLIRCHIEFEGLGPQTSFTIPYTQWDDLRLGGMDFQVKGANYPTIEDWQPGGSGAVFGILKFQKNDEGFALTQMPHSYQQGSNLECHIHWSPCDRGATESGALVGWKVDFSISNIYAAFPSSTTLDMSSAVTGIDDYHELEDAGAGADIDGTGLTISFMILVRVYRTDTGADDTWSGTTSAQSPGLLEVDFHFRKNSLGSDQEYIK